MPVWKKDRRGKRTPYGRVKIGGKQKVKRFKTWEEAQRWELQEKDHARELLKLTRTYCWTLHEFATDYLDHVQERVSSKTWTEKKLVFKRLYNDVKPSTPVEEITYAQLEDHLDRIAREVSGHRANKSRIHLVRAYNWGIKRKMVRAPNPWNVER